MRISQYYARLNDEYWVYDVKKLLLCCCLLLPAISWAEPIKLCVENKAFAPYVLGNGKFVPQEFPGTVVELHQMVADRLGVELQISRANWNNCIKRLKDGRTDAVALGTYIKSREAFAAFPKTAKGEIDPSRSTVEISYSVYTKADGNINWDGTLFTNLVKQRVSASRGYTAVEMLKKMGLDVIETRSIRSALNKLRWGHTEAAVELDLMVDNVAAKSPESMVGIKKSELPYWVSPAYTMFGKRYWNRNEQRVQSYWDALSQIKKSSEYADVLKQYNN